MIKMSTSSLSQQCLLAINLISDTAILSQWTLRITYIAALFAALQAVSAICAAPTAFVWCNLCICLWFFNRLCVQIQHVCLQIGAKKESTLSFFSCAFPLKGMLFFLAVFGCFIFLDWIPYVGTGLSILLTPLFFLLAAVPPIGILVQLALPLFVFPYLHSTHQPINNFLLLISSSQFLQNPSRTLCYFFLAYAPLAFVLLLLLGSWATVFMMNRFSDFWAISLLQKSLLIILSGVCLGPPSLFLAMMGIVPMLESRMQKASPSRSSNGKRDKERAQWFFRIEEMEDN